MKINLRLKRKIWVRYRIRYRIGSRRQYMNEKMSISAKGLEEWNPVDWKIISLNYYVEEKHVKWWEKLEEELKRRVLE